MIARLKTANIRLTDAQVERIWAIVSAHQAGLSIRKIAGATGLSSSRIHQLLNAPEGKEIPVWLSQLRQSSRGSGGKKKRPESETEIRSGLAREVEMLRRSIDWLQRLERGENVVVIFGPMKMSRRSLLLSTGRGWSSCWNNRSRPGYPQLGAE